MINIALLLLITFIISLIIFVYNTENTFWVS